MPSDIEAVLKRLTSLRDQLNERAAWKETCARVARDDAEAIRREIEALRALNVLRAVVVDESHSGDSVCYRQRMGRSPRARETT